MDEFEVSEDVIALEHALDKNLEMGMIISRHLEAISERGVCRATMVAIESLDPCFENGLYPPECYTQEPSDVNIEVALENIITGFFKLVGNIIAGVFNLIIGILDWLLGLILKLFGGDSGSSKSKGSGGGSTSSGSSGKLDKDIENTKKKIEEQKRKLAEERKRAEETSAAEDPKLSEELDKALKKIEELETKFNERADAAIKQVLTKASNYSILHISLGKEFEDLNKLFGEFSSAIMDGSHDTFKRHEEIDKTYKEIARFCKERPGAEPKDLIKLAEQLNAVLNPSKSPILTDIGIKKFLKIFGMEFAPSTKPYIVNSSKNTVTVEWSKGAVRWGITSLADKTKAATVYLKDLEALDFWLREVHSQLKGPPSTFEGKAIDDITKNTSLTADYFQPMANYASISKTAELETEKLKNHRSEMTKRKSRTLKNAKDSAELLDKMADAASKSTENKKLAADFGILSKNITSAFAAIISKEVGLYRFTTVMHMRFLKETRDHSDALFKAMDDLSTIRKALNKAMDEVPQASTEDLGLDADHRLGRLLYENMS